MPEGLIFEDLDLPEIFVHPKYILDADTLSVCELYGLFRPGMSGVGPLPCAGGTMDQPALLMECFEILSAAEAAIKREKDGK